MWLWWSLLVVPVAVILVVFVVVVLMLAVWVVLNVLTAALLWLRLHSKWLWDQCPPGLRYSPTS